MVFQDPFGSLNPVHRIEHFLRTGPRAARPVRGRPLQELREELMATVGLPDGHARLLPARAVRRPASARRDRPRSRRRTTGHPGRRTHLHARRLRPGRRAQPDAPAARRAGISMLYITHDLALRPLPRGHDHGDVRRRTRRGRRRSIDLMDAPPTPTPSCCCPPYPTRTGPAPTTPSQRARLRAAVLSHRLPLRRRPDRPVQPHHPVRHTVGRPGQPHWVRCHLYRPSADIACRAATDRPDSETNNDTE